MTLRNRARLALVVVAVCLVPLVVMVQRSFAASQTSRELSQHQLYPASRQVSELIIGNADMERGVAGYVLTGDPAALSSYVTGRARSAEAIIELRGSLTGELADLQPMLDAAAYARDTWISNVAEAQLELMRQGEPEGAEALVTSGISRRQFAVLSNDAVILDRELDERIADSVADLGRISGRLSLLLTVTAAAVIILTAMASWAMMVWVLRPLAALGAQMRRLARTGDTSTPLRPAGPPEVTDLGQDAEFLRRHLVQQIDMVRAADEGLAQESPTVANLRQLLAASPRAQLPGCTIATTALPAEGVMAGDWWNAIELGPEQGAAILSDISGHGPAAGVGAVRLRTALEVALVGGVDMQTCMSSAARLFTDDPSRFASAVIVGVDGDELWWLNAGHNEPVLIRSSGTVERLSATGPVLSALGGRWTTERVTWASGDVVVMFTDGLVEARTDDGDEVGDAQVIEWCRELALEAVGVAPSHRPQSVAQGLLDRARCASPDLRRDDVTIVVLQRGAAEPTGRGPGVG